MVSIVAGLGAGGPRVQSMSPGRGKIFSPLPVVQIGSGTHPASSAVGTRGFFPRSKAIRAWG